MRFYRTSSNFQLSIDEAFGYTARFGIGGYIVFVGRFADERYTFHGLFNHIAHAEEGDAVV